MIRRLDTYFRLGAYLLLLLLGGGLLAGCSVFGGSDPRWDTDVPEESKAFKASGGTWGPDGTQIAFEYTPDVINPDSGGVNQLWIADLEAGTRRPVTRGRVTGPDWGPDGEWIVFHTASIPHYLFKINVQGDSLVPLSGPGAPNPDLEDTVGGRWSPSGDRLLYAVSAGEDSGIYTMRPDGSSVEKIVAWSVLPSWFPDGNRIVYISWDQTVEQGSGRQKQIFVANADGTGIEKLTDLPSSGTVSCPSVSPSGTQIAFVYRGEDERPEVFLMRADGTNIRQVTGGPGLVDCPRWRPDGQKILFGRTIPNVFRSLYLLDVETLEVEPVFPAEEG